MTSPASHSPDYPARRAALWALYALDLVGGDPDDMLLYAYSPMIEQDDSLSEAWLDIERVVFGVSGDLERLNETIQGLSKRWRLHRMATIDRNILRLGAWTLLEGEGTPLLVITDCVELAKEYGDRGTPGFVNGLLDQLCQDHKISIR